MSSSSIDDLDGRAVSRKACAGGYLFAHGGNDDPSGHDGINKLTNAYFAFRISSQGV